MITIIIGTNRPNSFSKKVAEYYLKLIQKLGENATILDLSMLPHDFAFSALYQNNGKNEAFNQFQQIVNATDKFVFVIPEYNGSFPGVLKTFVDALKYPDSFNHKKAALVGVSSGVLGNAIGLSHFSDVLNHANVDILGLRIKLGQINVYFDGHEFSHEIYKTLLETQAKKLLAA